METHFVLTAGGWCWLILAALLIGTSKTGIPGVGMLAIPLVTMVMPARASTGIVLPMLIVGDVFAVLFYRRHAVWSHLLRIIPWAVIGIIVGYFALGRVTDRQLKPLIGGIILLLLALNYWRDRNKSGDEAVPHRWWFAALMGLLAGITTMMANAAGPIMIIYLLAMGLPKKEFVGTAAWYFFLLNWFKVPFSMNLGLINAQSLQLNLALIPAVAAGAAIGLVAIRHIPQKSFNVTVQILAALAALKLVIP